MLRRLVLLGMVVVLHLNPALALIHPEMGGSGGAHKVGGGGVPSLPVLVRQGFTEEEPYRNADMGPLGVVLSGGEFQITVTDMKIPGRGFPFHLERTYRSKRDVAGSVIGSNWHLSYDEYLREGIWYDNSVWPPLAYGAIQWTMGNGWRDLWIDADAGPEKDYKPFGGFFGRMRYLGTGLGYQIRYPDGTVKTFGRSIPHAPESTNVWALTRIEDRNGNFVSLRYRQIQDSTIWVIDTIADTLGRIVTFQYLESCPDGGTVCPEKGLLRAVTDFKGRSVGYSYDEPGRPTHLTKVQAPEVTGTPNGNDFCDSGCPLPRKTTTYRYASADGCGEASLLHNLTSITDGKGRQFLANQYYASTDTRCGFVGPESPVDHVRQQNYGGGLVSYAYRYLVLPLNAGVEEIALETTVTDRNGNVQVHSFNNQGNPLSIVTRTNRSVRTLAGADENDYTVTYRYHADGSELISTRTESGGITVDRDGNLVAYPGGMTVQYNYDQTNLDIFQRGNLLSVERTPDPARGGSQPSLSTFIAYEPLFNQPRTVTDAGGHATLFTYDYQEGTFACLTAPDGSGSVPAPVDPAWWPQTSASTQSPVEQFLGLSGNQSDINGDGYHRAGNPIRISEGPATDFAGTVGEEIATWFAYNDFGLPVIRRDAEYNETHFRYFAANDPDGDGRDLTPDLPGVQGEAGGGYLQEKILDATPAMPMPSPPPIEGRESGRNPAPANIPALFTYDRVGNVATVTDGRGIRTDYVVNSLNQIVQVTHAAQSSDSLAPALAYREQFTYDANNNMTRHRSERRDDGSTVPVNRWITLDIQYDTLDHRLAETITTDDSPVPISLTTAYAYDGNGNLRKTIYPAGNAVLREYDERDLLYTEVVLKSGSGDTYDPAVDSVTRYDYDGSGNVIQLTDPEGHAARSAHDGYNRKVVGFDPVFQKTEFDYDGAGNLLTQIVRGAPGGPTGAVSAPPETPYPELSSRRMFYDELGRLRRTDTKFFRNDGTAQVLLSTDSDAGLPDHAADDPAPAAGDGWVTGLVRYDRLGRVSEAVDDNGHASEIRYDGLGRRLRISVNPVAPFVYVPGGIDERNRVEHVYDAAGNVIEFLETEWGTDRSDPTNPNRKLPPQQHRTTFRYDSMNRLVETRLAGRVGSAALNYTASVVYDSRGNKIQVTDPAGGRMKSFFDGLNRILRTESGYFWDGSLEGVPPGMFNPSNPDGKITTRYGYDADSRLTSIVDDNSRTTGFAYDNLGRQTRITYPDGTYKQITYDRDSMATLWELVSYSGARLAVATRYDPLHRAVRKEVDNGQAPMFVGTKRQEFEYDGLGRMTRATDDVSLADGILDSEVGLTYNSLGNVISEVQSYQDLSTGRLLQGTGTVTSVYDGAGFRTQVTYPGGRTIGFLPDELNRLDTLVDSYTGSTRYDYLGPSRLMNRLFPNNTKLTMLSGGADVLVAGYDDARRVVDFAHKTGGDSPAVLAEFAYGFDRVGNRLFERRVHEPSGAGWRGETYAYDAVYRLIDRKEGDLDASGVLQNAASASQDFTLDGLGNWKSYRTNSVPYTNTTNSLNQYTQFQGPLGGRKLAHDFAGNLSNESLPEWLNRQYGYDFANRLVIYLDPAYNLMTYRYDALGRRISKGLNGSLITRFVHDGNRLIEERDGENGLMASYVYGPGSDEVLTRRRRSGSTASDIFYHSNSLGSVAAVTDSTGAILERYKYDAYGQVTFLSPTFTPLTSSAVYNNVLFTGRYYDTENGTYHYRARNYHPYLGRFLQRDPLGEAASLNLYAYVFDNPVNAADPTGMMTYGGWAGAEFQRLAQVRRRSFDSWSLQQKMQFSGTNWVRYADPKWRDFQGAQEKDDEIQEEKDREAERAAHEALLAQHDPGKQVDDSKKKSAANMDDPKGVAVLVLGASQNIADEESGQRNATEIDARAEELRGQGYVVFLLSSAAMQDGIHFTEVSAEAIQIVAEAVLAVTAGKSDTLDVRIEGYSKGSGGAVALTNALTDRGYAGSRISLSLIDPFVGADFSVVNNVNVSISVYQSTQWSPVKIGYHLGFGHDIFRGFEARDRIRPSFFSLTHGQMDTYSPGVLGLLSPQTQRGY